MVYRISVDTGGTFTDVVVAAADGSLERRNGELHARYAAVYRTARRLFQGEVLMPASAWPA